MFIRLLLALFLLGISNCYATDVERTVESVATTDSTKVLFTTIGTIVTADTVSKSLVNVGLGANLGVMWQASSTGTISFTIQPLRSFQRPTSETLSDASYVSWNGPNTVSDTQWHMATLDTVAEPYLRFRITATGQNNANTTVQIKVSKQ